LGIRNEIMLYLHLKRFSTDLASLLFHVRFKLKDASLTALINAGNLPLGTWQGIYVFEHRARSHRRKVLMRALSVE